jgi:hypothetical protein
MNGSNEKTRVKFSLNEDWLAVLIAFILILLAAIGVLGKTGINIIF